MTSEGPEAGIFSRLIEISRATFGGWDEYCLYPIMWPWVIARLRQLPAGSRILDIGAGVSPVPLFLAENGARVECVDKSDTVREFPTTEKWNGWGFCDYSRHNPNIAAHNCAIEEFRPSHRFDAIYSLGCLAHLPRTAREEVLRCCREWLRPGGIMLHGIDLIMASDFIWNRSFGGEIEPPVRHGTVDGLTEQLAELGFRINERRIIRAIPEARTDLLLLDCVADWRKRPSAKPGRRPESASSSVR